MNGRLAFCVNVEELSTSYLPWPDGRDYQRLTEIPVSMLARPADG